MSSDPSVFQRVVHTIVPSFLRRRFAYKLAVWMLVVVGLIAAVGGAGYFLTQETVADNTEQQMESAVGLQGDAIGDWVTEMEVRTLTIANSDVAASDEEGDLGIYLRNQQRSSFRYSILAIHALDTEAEEPVASSSGLVAADSLDNRSAPWADVSKYDDLETGDVMVGETFRGDLWEDESIGEQVYFAAKVPNEDRVIILVSELGEYVDGLHQSYDSQETSIVNSDDGSPVLVDDGVSLPPIDELRSGGADATRTTQSGSHVHAATDIERADWTVVTTVPESEAYETADLVGQTMLVVVGVALFGVLGVAVVIGRQTAVPLTRLRNKAQAMEEGDLDVELGTTRIDEIGQLYDGFASMRDALREQIREAQTAREEAEQARLETERTNEHLERKADEYSQVMQACADGDFTRRMDPDSENEAMESIAREFNHMLDAIEETTAHVKRFATEVATASEEVTASSEEVRNASEEVSSSVQRISDGAERQHEHLQEAATEVSTLSTTTEEIAASSDEVAEIAEETASAGDRGREAAHQAAEDMTVVAEETDEIVEQFDQLKAETEQIDELLEFIEDIAKQTNMLALNANIEASRAQESGGEGFSAVAQEVKELSQETQEATDQIQAQLTTLQEEADNAATVVQQANEQVDQSVESVEDAVEALENIAEYAERTNDGVQEISAATDDQADATNQVAAMIDNVAGISQETSREAESVAASAEEQTSALTQVSQNAGDLAQRAAQLSSTLDQFETDVDPDATGFGDAGGDEQARDVAVQSGEQPVDGHDRVADDQWSPASDDEVASDRSDEWTEAPADEWAEPRDEEWVQDGEPADPQDDWADGDDPLAGGEWSDGDDVLEEGADAAPDEEDMFDEEALFDDPSDDPADDGPSDDGPVDDLTDDGPEADRAPLDDE